MDDKLIRRHSQPWSDHELLYVDGIGCTYSINGDGVVVHLPGRASVALSALKSSRRAIAEPLHWRLENYA